MQGVKKHRNIALVVVTKEVCVAIEHRWEGSMVAYNVVREFVLASTQVGLARVEM